MREDITNYNDNGKWHGYQEWYDIFDNYTLYFRVNYKNGKETGYEEYHGVNTTNFYIR